MAKHGTKTVRSDFAAAARRVVSRIPRGRVMTYKEVAAAAGRPGAWRAVGNVLNKNHDPKVPCHRVIRSDGRTGGYNRGRANKARLLAREGWRPPDRGR